MIKFQLLCLVHKYLHCRSQLPIVFSKYFTLNKNIHHYNTRSTENLHLTRVSTARGARNVKFKASHLWNTLSEVLKSVQKLSTFKKCLKHYLLSDSVLVWTHCITPVSQSYCVISYCVISLSFLSFFVVLFRRLSHLSLSLSLSLCVCVCVFFFVKVASVMDFVFSGNLPQCCVLSELLCCDLIKFLFFFKEPIWGQEKKAILSERIVRSRRDHKKSPAVLCYGVAEQTELCGFRLVVDRNFREFLSKTECSLSLERLS